MIHIHFYYDIAKQNQDVQLILEGMNQPLNMTSYPKANKHYYFYDLILNDSCGYPITINYQYRLQNGTLLDAKTFTLKYESVVNIIIIKDSTFNSIVNSSLSASPTPNNSLSTPNSTIDAFFFLEIPPPLSSSATSVLILSPFPQLNGQKSIEMMYLKEHNLWVIKVSIDSSFPIPFIYYYSVKTNQNLFFGENRVRLIEFNSPVNRNNSVSVYDYFYPRIQKGCIPFYHRPFQISNFPLINSQAFETDFTRFELVYMPEESDKNLSEVGIVMSYDTNVSARLSKMEKHSYWYGIIELTDNFIMTTYSLRTTRHLTSGDDQTTFNSPINLLMPIKNVKFDNIHTRIVKSEVKSFPLILYFPLVSLKVGSEKPSRLKHDLNFCGTFNTIGLFSKFLKQTEITVIHLHIEKMPGSEIFLDPVQLDFSDNVFFSYLSLFVANPDILKIDSILRSQIELILNETADKPLKLTLNVLRDIKLLIVRHDFKMCKNFSAFESFKTVFADYFKSQIKLSEFEYYVQFVCYCQLFTNVQKAHLNGIQIITDVSVVDGIQRTIDCLPVISMYSSGIYFSDISNNEEHGFSSAQIRERFRDDSTFVSSTFCEKKGTFFCIKPEFKIHKEKTNFEYNNDNDLISFNDDNNGASNSDLCTIDKDKLKSSLLFIEPNLREHYFTSLIELNKIEEAKSLNSEKSDQDDMFDRLVHTSKCISASLIVDEKMSVLKKPLNLENLFILPSFSFESKLNDGGYERAYLVPDGLTPLRTSSFLANVDKQKVTRTIKNAFKKKGSYKVVYLNDFLFCCDLSSLAGHSVITGNDPDRRDILHVTVNDLMNQKESAIAKINDFLHNL